MLSCAVKSSQSKSHPFFSSNYFFIVTVGDSFIWCFDNIYVTNTFLYFYIAVQKYYTIELFIFCFVFHQFDANFFESNVLMPWCRLSIRGVHSDFWVCQTSRICNITHADLSYHISCYGMVVVDISRCPTLFKLSRQLLKNI